MTKAVTIKSKGRLTNTTYHKRCSGGQKYWWMRDASGDFVELGDRYRGDEYLEVELELEPGTYTIGCGPRGTHGIRETITVD